MAQITFVVKDVVIDNDFWSEPKSTKCPEYDDIEYSDVTYEGVEKYCSNCGEPHDLDANFCEQCGKQFVFVKD